MSRSKVIHKEERYSRVPRLYQIPVTQLNRDMQQIPVTQLNGDMRSTILLNSLSACDRSIHGSVPEIVYNSLRPGPLIT